MANPENIHLEKLCMAVCTLAQETGQFILEKQQKLATSNIHIKGANDFVTDVDKATEVKLVHALEKLLPEAGFIAEEGTSDKVGEVYQWVIDPIDGTTNFIHSIPCFSISIGLQRADEMVLGVVYEINQQECFYAWEDSDAFLNGRKISVSPTGYLKDTLIATGFPYQSLGKQEEYLKVFQDLLNNSRGLRRLGSAAVDLAYVACGRFDGFYEYNLNPWDVAAGTLIVQRAGGMVSDFNGLPKHLSGNQIIASNGLIHEPFRQTIVRHFS